MIKPVSQRKLDRIRQRLSYLYGEDGMDRLMDRVGQLIGRYGTQAKSRIGDSKWDQKESILITYGDSIVDGNLPPLTVLKNFADKHLRNAFSAIHVLPFSPYSSEDGFSVIDYRAVNPELGDWKKIRELRENFGLMFDIVLNHCSAQSEWFKEFLEQIEPARNYFVTANPELDLSQVVRPRTSPLLTPVKTRNAIEHVWTTFSADQVDLNWKSPDLLFEFFDIVLFYISQGARFFRMDAVAFLWKEIGTNCLHLPQTHEVVKLFRDVIEIVCPRSIIITETNVPQPENYSYFDQGDEAHMVYQFTLPPLLLYSLLSGDATALTNWAGNIPEIPEGCTFFNFAASHDGIGVRPIEGILSDAQRDSMIKAVEQRGGQVSYKTNSDGSQSPYELNITYYSALEADNEAHTIARFLCSQSVVMTLQGIPGIYIHSLMGTQNDIEYMKKRQQNRSINRKKWNSGQLDSLLSGKHESHHKTVFDQMLHMLQVRGHQHAFHPDAKQLIHHANKELFIVERVATDGTQRIFAIHNFSDQPIELEAHEIPMVHNNLLTGKKLKKKGENYLIEPYGVVWAC